MEPIQKYSKADNVSNKNLPDNRDPIFCRFGRFSVSKRDAVFLAVSIPVSEYVVVSLGIFYGINPVVSAVAGIIAGAFSGIIVREAAEHLYVKCHHAIPTDSPVNDDKTPLLQP